MNDNPTESDLLKDPNKVLDDAYNKGVDDAIKSVEEVLDYCDSDDSPTYVCEKIVSKLSKLKSNDSR
jgi:hypothetical protein